MTSRLTRSARLATGLAVVVLAVPVFGVLLWVVVPAIGLFFLAFGAFILLASPVIGLLQRWGGRGDG